MPASRRNPKTNTLFTDISSKPGRLHYALCGISSKAAPDEIRFVSHFCTVSVRLAIICFGYHLIGIQRSNRGVIYRVMGPKNASTLSV